uniref:Uncharacterized protein n=1 Tax=Cacopsylla melanoneura TaxID=428564 RepID=A0A8D8Z443_9HEMI
MRATRPHSCGSLFCDCEYSTGTCIKLYSKLNPTESKQKENINAKKQVTKREDLNKQYDNYQKILLNQYYQSKPSPSAGGGNSSSLAGNHSKRKSSLVSNSNKTSFIHSNDRFSARKVSFSDPNNINKINSNKSSKLSESNRQSCASQRKSSNDTKGTFIRLSTIWKTKDNFSAGDFVEQFTHEPKRSIYLQNQPISFVELLNERNPKCSLFKIENFETIEDINSDGEEDFYWNKKEAFTGKMGKIGIILISC